MGLLPRVYYTLHEASIRWDCSLADIAGWASAGRFEIVTELEPVIQGSRVVAEFVAVSVTDILQMFRRCGTGPKYRPLKRVRPREEEEWVLITDPEERVEVSCLKNGKLEGVATTGYIRRLSINLKSIG